MKSKAVRKVIYFVLLCIISFVFLLSIQACEPEVERDKAPVHNTKIKAKEKF